MDKYDLNNIVARCKEYGKIFKTIKSADVKETLVYSAPVEVLNAYRLVAKNILLGNIKLTQGEHSHLKKFKKALYKLGIQKCSSNMKKRLLCEGDILLSLSRIMAKMNTIVHDK